MAIVKQDHNLEEAKFVFDEAGEVTDLILQVNYQLWDNVTKEEETRVRKIKSIWADLTNGQKTQANTIGKKLNSVAKAF